MDMEIECGFGRGGNRVMQVERRKDVELRMTDPRWLSALLGE